MCRSILEGLRHILEGLRHILKGLRHTLEGLRHAGLRCRPLLYAFVCVYAWLCLYFCIIRMYGYIHALLSSHCGCTCMYACMYVCSYAGRSSVMQSSVLRNICIFLLIHTSSKDTTLVVKTRH